MTVRPAQALLLQGRRGGHRPATVCPTRPAPRPPPASPAPLTRACAQQQSLRAWAAGTDSVLAQPPAPQTPPYG